MENNQQQDWLETMPEEIQKWIGSANLTYLIINLNRQLGFKGQKITVIPYLIFRIANKELAPEKIIESLSRELSINKETAVMIAKEMKEKMLKPIEAPLRMKVGFDINMIDFAQSSVMPAPKPVMSPVPPAPPAPSAPKPTQPTETKIPINVYKPEQENKDSWLNRLK